jgi:large subunit ribosomal protein L23
VPRSTALQAASRSVRTLNTSASLQSPPPPSAGVESSSTARPTSSTTTIEIDNLPHSAKIQLKPVPTSFNLSSGLQLDFDETTIANRKNKASSSKDTTLLQKCVHLLKWTWLDSSESEEAIQRVKDIREALQSGREVDTTWLEAEYELAKSFRQARSRLWTPTDMSDADLTRLIEEKGSHKLVKLNAMNPAVYEGNLDVVLKPFWVKLTQEERKVEGLRARFNCIRRLGWRKAYSSGYPLSSKEEKDDSISKTRSKLLTDLISEKKSTSRTAMAQLAVDEEAAAWQAWKDMGNASRLEEEKVMWAIRDRSMIYIDDSTAFVLGSSYPRWFSQPQKIGEMIFLPNVVVRLVRNNTQRSGQYDAFKATFRVPLSMHKHSLRSYLLAIYGLRTTWCRSSIYRAANNRNRVTRQKVVGSARRTFKKVEVGLLEPFRFPEITEQFQRDTLLKEEVKFEIINLYFKMSGKRRWRSKVAPQPVPEDTSTAALEEGSVSYMYDGESRTTQGSTKEGEKKTPESVLSVMGGQRRTANKRAILRQVHKQRLAKEAEVAARMQQLQSAAKVKAEQASN